MLLTEGDLFHDLSLLENVCSRVLCCPGQSTQTLEAVEEVKHLALPLLEVYSA